MPGRVRAPKDRAGAIEAAMKAPGLAPPLAVPYLGKQWATEALRRIESDERVQSLATGGQVSLLTIILAPPEGRYGFLYAAFDEKGLVDYRVGHDYHVVTQGIAPPTFVVSGPYEVFAEIQKGTLSQRRALMSGRLHLTGSLRKAVRHMRTLEGLTAVLSEIECDT